MTRYKIQGGKKKELRKKKKGKAKNKDERLRMKD
jgi:hypothetical protein